nr:MAG TPA: hypothetical protein [Caudoviricetes sp.]
MKQRVLDTKLLIEKLLIQNYKQHFQRSWMKIMDM